MKTLRKVSEVRMMGARVLLKASDVKKGEIVRTSGIITAEELPEFEAVVAEIVAKGAGVSPEFQVGDSVVIIPSHVLEIVFAGHEFEQEAGVKYYQCDEEDLFGKI
jgi:hypothetical protein